MNKIQALLAAVMRRSHYLIKEAQWLSVALALIAPVTAFASISATTPNGDGNYVISWALPTTPTPYATVWVTGSQIPPGPQSGPAAGAYGRTGSILVENQPPGTYLYAAEGCRYGNFGVRICDSQRYTVSVTVAAAVVPPSSIPTPSLPGAGITGSSYTVSWNSVSGADHYYIQQRTGTGSWSGATRVNGLSRSYTQSSTNLYSYRVKACNSSACTAYSASKSIRIDRGLYRAQRGSHA